jgi:hypothetical protein
MLHLPHNTCDAEEERKKMTYRKIINVAFCIDIYLARLNISVIYSVIYIEISLHIHFIVINRAGQVQILLSTSTSTTRIVLEYGYEYEYFEYFAQLWL